jgi:hypothetical protein
MGERAAANYQDAMDSQLLLRMILERSSSVQWGGGIVCILQPVENLEATRLNTPMPTQSVDVN